MTWGIGRPPVLPDVQRAVIDYLASLGPTLDGAPVDVVAGYPEEATPEAPSLPALVVLDDGADRIGRVSERRLIQVTAWATNPTPSLALARHAHGALLAFPGSRQLGAITPATFDAPVQDPLTEAWLASFTVRVHARAT